MDFPTPRSRFGRKRIKRRLVFISSPSSSENENNTVPFETRNKIPKKRPRRVLREHEYEAALLSSDGDFSASSSDDFFPDSSGSSSDSEYSRTSDLGVETTNPEEPESNPQDSPCPNQGYQEALSVQQEISDLDLPQPVEQELLSISPDVESQPQPVPRRKQLEKSTIPWSETNEGMTSFDFIGNPGLKINMLANNNPKPIEFLNIFLDDEYLQFLVEQTNKHAAHIFQKPGVRQKSRITEWKDTTIPEMRTFIGLILHMGVIRLNRISDYWKTHRLFNISCYRKYMSRNRFLLLFRCLHFSNTEEGGLNKVEEIIKRFNEKMKAIISAQKCLSLDESMVLWRGRLFFKQYIKNKRHKYGMKLYLLTEPDGLVLRMHLFGGSSDITSGKGHTEKIVMHLLNDFLDKGHSVFMDNFYNGYNLALKLLQRKTYCSGTLRKKREFNPTIVSTKLKKGENKSVYHRGVHIGCFRDKRYIPYISTEFDNEMVVVESKRGNKKMKPKVLAEYNKYMSGIDRQDQMLSYYPCERKTLRWYKKLFVHILQMQVLNAYIIYNRYSGKNLNMYDFRMALSEELLPPVCVETVQTSRRNGHKLTKIDATTTENKSDGPGLVRLTTRIKRKVCRYCSISKKIRKQTTFHCTLCDGQPGFCNQECFDSFEAHNA
ncbi:unnamed protein product [Parnassius apollo]|uniref:(apollo) hypothetical protein n=1 Tax=Parnassius apollo TaxID=110799 RepID=A0A8S3XI22_PARAO|nr:unnamed protein product [Parnassius apollo]